MKPARERRLWWLLPLALYAAFFWRTPYSLKAFPLRVLDWVLPVVGLGAWVIFRWRRGDAWPRTSLDLSLLAWLAATVLTTALSTSLRSSLWQTWEIFLVALVLWLLVDAARRGWSPPLWRALYLVGAVVCVIAAVELLAWYFGWPLLHSFQQGWPAIGGLADPLPPSLHRVGLALVNLTALSAFIAMLIPPAVCILVATRDREVRLGMTLWLLAAGTVMLVSQSRGGFLALGVSLPLLVLGAMTSPQFRRRWSGLGAGKTRLLLAGASLLILVIAVGAGFLLAARLGEHSSGDAVRLDLWRSAGAMFLDHPLTGVGPSAYGTALRSYREPRLARDHVTAAHNLYLNVGAEMGAVGLLAGGWLLLTLALAWWRRWRAERPGTPAWWRILGIGAALSGLAAQSVVDTFIESAIVLTAAFFVAEILAPPSHPMGPGAQPRRWPWAVALMLLVLGAAGMAWDTRAHAEFTRALSLTREGAVEEAIAATEQARALDAWMSLYACHAGYLYGLQAAGGEADALPLAIERYGECMDGTAVPDRMDRVNLSALLWQAGQGSEARAMVQEASEREPADVLSSLNAGLWAEMAGDRGEAVSLYGRVLSLDPKLAGSPFWRQGERAEWWPDILAAAEQSLGGPGERALPWRWQVLLAAGQHGEAAQEIDGWLQTHPNDHRAMAGLGEALVGLGQPAEALAWLDRSLAGMPGEAQTYRLRGEAELALGEYKEAEHDLRMALFLEPEPRVHLALARLAQATGDAETALQHYALALPEQSLAQGTYVVLYRRMGWPTPLPQVARIGYRQYEAAAVEWGKLLEEAGDPKMAAIAYEFVLRQDPYIEAVRQRLDGLRRP